MAGKGDKRRPQSVSMSQFDSNWDLVFGKNKKKKYIKDGMKPSGNRYKSVSEILKNGPNDYKDD